MSPAFASWIQGHGKKLDSFPSQVYKTVQLWYVPASPYDPAADIVNVPGGVFVNTVGSHCGGYTVIDGRLGSFYSEYQALGGKGVLGDPLSRVTASNQDGRVQLFDGAVLAGRPNTRSPIRPLPIVAMFANKSLTAYQRAGLPAIVPGATTTQRLGWLTNLAIRRTYLDSDVDTLRAYSAAVRRYGQPLGPPSEMPGGVISQPFADSSFK